MLAVIYIYLILYTRLFAVYALVRALNSMEEKEKFVCLYNNKIKVTLQSMAIRLAIKPKIFA